MTTQVSLVFSATTNPTNLDSDLSAAMAAVLLPTSDVNQIGLTLTSDTTAMFAGGARRTLVFSTLPPFISDQNSGVCNGGCYASIVSSSDLDTQVIQIRYTDPDGDPQSILGHLSGSTLVGLPPRDIVTITGVLIHDGPTNNGLISVISGTPDLPGPLLAQRLGNFQGYAISTSANDALGDIGAQSIRIDYHDSVGAGPFNETVALSGQTPAVFNNLNHATVNNLSVPAFGTSGSSLGIISVYSGLSIGKGILVAHLGQSFQSLFPLTTIVAPGIDLDGNLAFGQPTANVSPSPADQTGPLRQLYAQALSAAIGSQVTSAAPVFS